MCNVHRKPVAAKYADLYVTVLEYACRRRVRFVTNKDVNPTTNNPICSLQSLNMRVTVTWDL
jgi:hypothetical protein